MTSAKVGYPSAVGAGSTAPSELTVGEHIGGELKHVWEDLLKHLRLFLGASGLELRLNVPRTELVASKFDNVPDDVLRNTSKSAFTLAVRRSMGVLKAPTSDDDYS